MADLHFRVLLWAIRYGENTTTGCFIKKKPNQSDSLKKSALFFYFSICMSLKSRGVRYFTFEANPPNPNNQRKLRVKSTTHFQYTISAKSIHYEAPHKGETARDPPRCPAASRKANASRWRERHCMVSHPMRFSCDTV